MSEITVPPAVRFQFEKRAQEICELGKIDYSDVAETASEMTRRMEDRWRKCEEKMTTDDAMEAALAIFGPAEDVAAVYRGGLRGLWHRLLYYQRYTVHRLVAPIIFCLFHTWLRSSGSMEIHWVSSKDLEWRMVLFGWDYYIGVITVVAIVSTRWIANRLGLRKDIGQWIALAITLALFSDIAIEWSHSVSNLLSSDWRHMAGLDNVPYWEELLAIIVYLGAFVVEAILFAPMMALVAAEIFQFGSVRRNRIRAKQTGAYA